MKTALVIGAGVAGLAVAIRLRLMGYAVQVFESNAFPGGKLHAFSAGDYRFDAGPSLFTLPHYVDELFVVAGKNPRDYFNYSRKKTVCHYFWPDDSFYPLPANRDEFINTASAFFNEPAQALQAYLECNALKYERTAPLFVERSLHKMASYWHTDTLKGIAAIPKLDLFNTLNEVNEQAFSNPKLIQLFNRYATYNGSSPYETPGIMSMIPHLEMALGTYFPEGGMVAITNSLYQLAQEVGVRFYLNTPVERILYEGSSVKGVLSREAVYPGDVVVCNRDVFSAYKTLLPDVPAPEKILKQERSTSGIIFYWGIKQHFPQLDLHNIFFSADYKTEFDALFQHKTVPTDPTVYVNISSKEEAKDAPAGCENWFVMVNAPANTGQDWDALVKQTRQAVLTKLSSILKTNIEDLIACESVLEPRRIEQVTASYQGSLYGTASNSRYAAFLRHPNFSKQFSNLFFCGGSVHPGGGIPLCLQSARIVSDLISPTP
ncbi:MAG: phytoene desaturase [Chitinophagaceae bacterium]|nr:phytoene desaturase [Chitinophagaceae bacterium]